MLFWRELLVIIWFHVLRSYAAPLSTTVTSTATVAIATPLVIPPSQLWEGDDGPWSSFNLRVGSPPQIVGVLVSTSSNQPLVNVPSTCGIDGCADDRGGVFRSNVSSTYTSTNATYALALNANIGLVPAVRYGYDTLALGFDGNGSPALASQLVGEILTADLFTGFLGLSPLATNFSSDQPEVASYMTNLKVQQQIPSLSYGYNAGNNYRGVFASLTLGGYDASVFDANNLSFAFNTQSSSDLTVIIDSITQESASGSGTLLSTTIPAFIDSSTPYLWLPEEVCTEFEQQFGITYDAVSGLYLVNDTLHDSLLAKNANITFKLGNTTSPEKVEIVLPYGAFDLQASPPLVGNATRYFPLKRANTTAQVTLGRTFLQEAYLIADYERSTFSVHQMNWNSTTGTNIIPIVPPSSPTAQPNSTAPVRSSRQSVPAGTIAAATLASVAFVSILVASLFFFRRRQRQKRMEMLTMVKSPLSPPPPAGSGFTYSPIDAPIVHAADCEHSQSRSASPEPVPAISESASWETMSPGQTSSDQASSMDDHDPRRPSTPILAGLAIPPISPLSSYPDTTTPNSDRNNHVSPITPGPTIPPRFSSLDRLAIPTNFEPESSRQVPSAGRGIYELPAIDHQQLPFNYCTTPIESLLQAALDQVIASHNREYHQPAQPQSQQYIPFRPSSPIQEERRSISLFPEQGGRQLHSPIYGPTAYPHPRRKPTPMPKRKRLPTTNSSALPNKPIIRTNPDLRTPSTTHLHTGNTPISRFNASPTTAFSPNMNHLGQNFTFDIHPDLRGFPLPPIPSASHSHNHGHTHTHTHNHPHPHHRPKNRQVFHDPQHAHRTPPRSPHSRPRSIAKSRPESKRLSKKPKRERRSRQRQSMYPPPSSLPPMYPLPALPGGFDSSNGALNGISANQRTSVRAIHPPPRSAGDLERSPVSGGSEVDVREYSWLRLE